MPSAWCAATAISSGRDTQHPETREPFTEKVSYSTGCDMNSESVPHQADHAAQDAPSPPHRRHAGHRTDTSCRDEGCTSHRAW